MSIVVGRGDEAVVEDTARYVARRLTRRGTPEISFYTREGLQVAVVIHRHERRGYLSPLLGPWVFDDSDDRLSVTMRWPLPDEDATRTNLCHQIENGRLTSARGNLFMWRVHYGLTSDVVVVTHDPFALENVTDDVHRLEPGERLVLDDGIIGVQEVQPLQKPAHPRFDSEQNAVALLAAVLPRCLSPFYGVDVGVLFSGGVDSSLIALLRSHSNARTILFAVIGPDSRDVDASQRAAEKLNLNLVTVPIDHHIVWEMLPELIYATGTTSQMDIAISIPMYAAAREAVKRGFVTLLSGQGPDELFGGYAHHVKILRERGPEALDETLWSQVSTTHRNNLERDEAVVAWAGGELWFPYVAPEVVDLALSIPPLWKVDPGGKPERKVIFRRAAVALGLDREIAEAPKSAAQFSSGSDRLLIEAVRHHCRSGENLSLRRARRHVQDVLDDIARYLHSGGVEGGEPGFDTSAADRLLAELDRMRGA